VEDDWRMLIDQTNGVLRVLQSYIPVIDDSVNSVVGQGDLCRPLGQCEKMKRHQSILTMTSNNRTHNQQ
jgi:hypothetical protein